MHRSALFGCIYRAVFVYVWLSSSLTVQSGLRVLRVAVPKYRHAGTGTIFRLLPTPSISHMLLIVGNWPAASWNGDLSEQITKGPEVFCQTTESWSYTYVQKRTKGICKPNLVAQTALAVKTFLSVSLVRCRNWRKACYELWKQKHRSNRSSSTKLFGATFTQDDAKTLLEMDMVSAAAHCIYFLYTLSQDYEGSTWVFLKNSVVIVYARFLVALKATPVIGSLNGGRFIVTHPIQMYYAR